MRQNPFFGVRVRGTLTMLAAIACATVAIALPDWRTELLAKTYYKGGLRMTGGGTIGTTSFKHGFVLQCDATDGPNSLEVNWGKGNKFHLETLTSASCSPPGAGFDTYDGAGTGRLNGTAGATAEWTFTDAGEPGTADFADIVITDAQGNVFSASGFLSKGNHQAHGK